MIIISDFPPSMLRGKGCFFVLAELVSQKSRIELRRGLSMFLNTKVIHLGAVGNLLGLLENGKSGFLYAGWTSKEGL